MERPIDLILREEQTKLFFHDLIVYLQSNGYKQGVSKSGVNDEGMWEERSLFYECSNSFGESKVDLHSDHREVIVSLSEYSYDGRANIYEYWVWRKGEYNTSSAIEKIEKHSQVHELFSRAFNNPTLPPTEMEHKENIKRQLKFFDKPVEYLRKLGFKQDDYGFLEVCLKYLDNEFEIKIELGENEGVVMVDVHEYNLKTKHQAATSWVERSSDYKAKDMIERLGNSFHFSRLGRK